MRLGEALATCPSLVLVDRDPVTVEREWEGVLRRLEDAGFAVDPVEQGAVVFETKGVERLYGGVQPALERALAAVGTTWDPRSALPAGASPRSQPRASRVPVRFFSSPPRRNRRSSSRCRSLCSR